MFNLLDLFLPDSSAVIYPILYWQYWKYICQILQFDIIIPTEATSVNLYIEHSINKYLFNYLISLAIRITTCTPHRNCILHISAVAVTLALNTLIPSLVSCSTLQRFLQWTAMWIVIIDNFHFGNKLFEGS